MLMGIDRWARRASGLLLPTRRFAWNPWRFLPCEDCCEEECNCTQCDIGTTPAQLQVVISGVQNQDCPNCVATFNGTFVLDQVATGFPVGDCCCWEYSLGATVCNATHLFAAIYPSGAFLWFLVAWGTGCATFTTTATEWFRSFGIAFSTDCQWVNLNVGFARDIGSQCDGSGSTCLVTAL